MPDDIPEGFSPAALDGNYGRAFGPVWLDRLRSKFGFRVSDAHSNPVGALHGGALATFANAQLMVFTPDVGGPSYRTINLSVDYLAPAAVGAWVEAQAVLIKRTRSMVFTQSVIAVDGEPIARSSAIYRILENTGDPE